MSLIQEALDKIQEKRFGKTGARARPIPVPDVDSIITGISPEERAVKAGKRARSKVPAVAVAVIFAIAALFIALAMFGPGLLKNGAKNRAKARPTEVAQNVIYRPIAPPIGGNVPGAASAARAVKPAGMPKLILNGIMYIEGRPRAIVNGYTVSEGATVSGAILKEIRKDSVVFHANNAEITIELK